VKSRHTVVSRPTQAALTGETKCNIRTHVALGDFLSKRNQICCRDTPQEIYIPNLKQIDTSNVVLISLFYHFLGNILI